VAAAETDPMPLVDFGESRCAAVAGCWSTGHLAGRTDRQVVIGPNGAGDVITGIAAAMEHRRRQRIRWGSGSAGPICRIAISGRIIGSAWRNGSR
jgi:hypothetical protein